MEFMADEESRDKFYRLIQLLRISQQEYLHFLNVYTKYIRHTVLYEHRKQFDVMELLKGGVNKLILGHDVYLDKILDEMFLTQKVRLFFLNIFQKN
jgi:Gamma tubulin complex component C-terminal